MSAGTRRRALVIAITVVGAISIAAIASWRKRVNERWSDDPRTSERDRWLDLMSKLGSLPALTPDAVERVFGVPLVRTRADPIQEGWALSETVSPLISSIELRFVPARASGFMLVYATDRGQIPVEELTKALGPGGFIPPSAHNREDDPGWGQTYSIRNGAGRLWLLFRMKQGRFEGFAVDDFEPSSEPAFHWRR